MPIKKKDESEHIRSTYYLPADIRGLLLDLKKHYLLSEGRNLSLSEIIQRAVKLLHSKLISQNK